MKMWLEIVLADLSIGGGVTLILWAAPGLLASTVAAVWPPLAAALLGGALVTSGVDALLCQ